MAVRRPPGTPGRIISFFRDVLLGRPALETPWLRTVPSQATRSPDPPNMPKGPADELAFNYYYTRDDRRDAQPPTIASSFKPIPQLNPPEGGTETSTTEVSTQKVSTTPPIPGSGHPWRQID